jgi:hypothetical protein
MINGRCRIRDRLFCLLRTCVAILALVVSGAKPVTVERIKVHGTALEGNLERNAVDRDVLVFLPPGYAKDRQRRYPVVYALHGYSIGAEQWSGEIHVPQTRGSGEAGLEKMVHRKRLDPYYEG